MTESASNTNNHRVRHDVSMFTNDDVHWFNEGTHYQLYEKLGSQPMQVDGEQGTYFAVWAPNAESVFVTGDFNHWTKDSHPLQLRGQSGIWEGWVSGISRGAVYKYAIYSARNAYQVEKADPYAFMHETPPRTGSVVWDLEYAWKDHEWMAKRHQYNHLQAPMAVYEMHVGSWRRNPEHDAPLTYRELAEPLAEYLNWIGYTHVEFLPIMEHPFYGSWGYQTTGFFAPTSRYGTPQDFMYLVDYLHKHNIGVILDWVPSHFPTDEHGIGYFDGTHLYEHSDPRQGIHQDWDSCIFNYGRNEVRNFLMSSALYWLERYHVDGLRVDAVASMLYLDYSRKQGEWIPNKYGGRENLEAIHFLRTFNSEVFKRHADVQTFAEESTAWPMVSRPTYVGGLGFGLKWDMGWMHDTLAYMSHDPVFRKYHHNQLTFRTMYAGSENFILPLSHDEVVHGKASLLGKMPGDDWRKFANLRLLFAYMYSQPAKKLMFMGGEFGQWREWAHDSSLDWHLTDSPNHKGLMKLVRSLNLVYRYEPALHQYDLDGKGYQWIDSNDSENSILSYLRLGESGHKGAVVVVLNFTPVPHYNYRIGVPTHGHWRELINTDAKEFGGSGHGNLGGIQSTPIPCHGRTASINIVVPPLGGLYLKHEPPA